MPSKKQLIMWSPGFTSLLMTGRLLGGARQLGILIRLPGCLTVGKGSCLSSDNGALLLGYGKWIESRDTFLSLLQGRTEPDMKPAWVTTHESCISRAPIYSQLHQGRVFSPRSSCCWHNPAGGACDSCNCLSFLILVSFLSFIRVTSLFLPLRVVQCDKFTHSSETEKEKGNK